MQVPVASKASRRAAVVLAAFATVTLLGAAPASAGGDKVDRPASSSVRLVGGAHTNGASWG